MATLWGVWWCYLVPSKNLSKKLGLPNFPKLISKFHKKNAPCKNYLKLLMSNFNLLELTAICHWSKCETVSENDWSIELKKEKAHYIKHCTAASCHHLFS